MTDPHPQSPLPAEAQAPTEEQRAQTLRRKNLQWAGICAGVMVITAIWPWIYAPIYRQICSTLGISTSQAKSVDVLLDEARAASLPPTKVRFMGVSGELPITIEPLTQNADVALGKTFAVTYRLTNTSGRDLDYRAVHMVEPAKDGSFELIKCFCDGHRVIKANATEDHLLTFRLTKPPLRPDGLIVNYTLFAYTGNEPVVQ
jgi:cytochrome c oxidase assembly protein Cox11